MALGRILEGFITILIGANLVSPVADAIYVARGGQTGAEVTNITGSSGTLMALVTLFFVLGVMVAGVQLAVGGLAEIGLI